MCGRFSVQESRLKNILDKKSCLHDLEMHLNNREKFCSPPGTTLDDAAMRASTQASAMRRFALQYMHSYPTEKTELKKDGAHTYCFRESYQMMCIFLVMRCFALE